MSSSSYAQLQDEILFTGRFDFSDTTKAVFSHVSSSIKARFNGTGISASLSAEKGISYLQVIIDGIDEISSRIKLEVSSKEQIEYSLAEGLQEGLHQVELIKLNQYDTKLAFHGFTVEGTGLASKPERPEVSIEYYGDSNPAGHSAWDVFDRGAVSDNGGYHTYPGITARMLNAEYINVSMGGSGITNKAWRNLVDHHHLIHMDDPATGTNIWDFENNHLNFTADAVVINLGANDYYGSATKFEIKNGWKDFIITHLRAYYPNAHIVLANSYGWAYNEPADYVNEAIEELIEAGDTNVSNVKFPWLWGQEHAVVNEHAGFANILASHLAFKLNVPEPELSELSSFVGKGQIYNGSFEQSILSGVADGWRPHSNQVSLITNSGDAYDGDSYLRIQNSSWVNFANDAHEGDIIAVSAWVRKSGAGSNLGKLKIEFKDQAQNTIASSQGLFGAASEWRQATNTFLAPTNTWSVWVVLEAEENAIIDFDRIEMTGSQPSGIHIEREDIFSQNHSQHDDLLYLYPNPIEGHRIFIKNLLEETGTISVYDAAGNRVVFENLNGEIDQSLSFSRKLPPGMYTVLFNSDEVSKYTKMMVY